MKKDNKTRLFEVMQRLDKTFKPKLNEGFEDEITFDTNAESPEESPIKEKTVEEKYEELKEKVEELYSIIHSEESEEETGIEEPGEEEAGIEEPGEEEAGEEEMDDEETNDDLEALQEKKQIKEISANSGKKIPVAAIPKVGK